MVSLHPPAATSDLPAGRRPATPPSATAPPARPGITLRERGINWGHRVRNGFDGLKNPNLAMPPVGIPQTPSIGGRKTRR